MDYNDFVAHKFSVSQATGIGGDVDINRMLFPFQRDIVRWALRRGRAAIFADCGMGKTPMQLEWARIVHAVAGHDVIILAPLAVAAQTVAEGKKFDIAVNLCRKDEDVRPGINIANYEIMHKFNMARFGGVVLDESSILKSYSGKTRNQIIESFAQTPFRLACTATPAPNDHMELGNHSEFLGAMPRTEMLSMYFVHDGGDTSEWRLKGHAENTFWEWVCSWGVMIGHPSDLGYEDAGFTLPELRIHEKVLATGKTTEGMLFAMPATTLTEQRSARRTTLVDRVRWVADLVNSSPGPWLVWCELNSEGDALTSAIRDAVQIEGADSPETKEHRMVGFSNGEIRVLVTKASIAGFGMNWQHCHQMAFVGLSHSYEQFYQAVRRCWRFGQKHPVDVHVVTSDLETAVLGNVKRKEKDAQTMAKAMIGHMRETSMANVRGLRRERGKYTPSCEMALPEWLEESGREG